MQRDAKRARRKSTDNIDYAGEEDLIFQPPAGALPSPVPVPPGAAEPETTTRQGEPLLVMKFGGSSLAGVEHLRRVVAIVRKNLHLRPVVVLSAMGSTTNELLAAADNALKNRKADISSLRATHNAVWAALGIPEPASVEPLWEELNNVLLGIGLLQEISPRTRDLTVSFGERLSVRVFEAFYNQDVADGQPKVRAYDSWDIGMKTTSGAGSTSSAFSQVEVLNSSYSGIAAHLQPLQVQYEYIPVVTGYIAKDDAGVVTTLGRDGSDLTATIIGAATRASEVQIWKDVSGILTTDPRLVPKARPVRVLTYEEAAELTVFGAKVVHPAAVMPAWMGKVPIVVRNSMLPDEPGTRIVTDLQCDDRKDFVAAMSSKKGITMVTIKSTRMLGQHGFLAHVFQAFDKFEVSVDVISTSEITVSLTLDRGFKSVDLFSLRRELEKVATVEIIDHMATLTLITSKSNSGMVLKRSFEVFEALGTRVEMVSHGASNVNVTFVVSASSLSDCTQKLHAAFFE